MNKHKTSIKKYILISMLVLIISMTVSAIVTSTLLSVIKSESVVNYTISLVEGIIATIATGLVLYQLKLGEQTERHQNDIEEATFALQYNQAFIQDNNMVEVEQLLENQAYYDDEPREILTVENRHKFINYLVYIESMAPLVLTGVLDLDYIDNLMAYRFFMIIDNVEVQEKEIFPFADYYRGCFLLYKIWVNYRKEKGLGFPKDDCKNQNVMRELSKYKEFEKYCSK
ncbi:MAG: hypothetical protein K5871_09885 [Lachnospiraceae bacterium]|nr:hypothetical protein [Lachnospiraceae bacterium]